MRKMCYFLPILLAVMLLLSGCLVKYHTRIFKQLNNENGNDAFTVEVDVGAYKESWRANPSFDNDFWFIFNVKGYDFSNTDTSFPPKIILSSLELLSEKDDELWRIQSPIEMKLHMSENRFSWSTDKRIYIPQTVEKIKIIYELKILMKDEQEVHKGTIDMQRHEKETLFFKLV
jgi:hypothetical protein